MALPVLADPFSYAYFLDFDGTLVEIAEQPQSVSLLTPTRDALARLSRATAGAVAIVTGRDISDVDFLIAPLRLPVAGVHGLTRRDGAGALHGLPSGAFLVDGEAALLRFANANPGVLVERKAGALALHYRARPDLEASSIATVEAIAERHENVRVTRGKMVVEARRGGADKGTAIAAFLTEPPFFRRRPVFAGDDVTDEDAFALVAARGGITIKIGDGASLAEHRAASTAEFIHWLATLGANAPEAHSCPR